MTSILPDVTTPAELADRLGWSERSLRYLARRLGACRVLGNRMVLLPQDVHTIMEATRCPSNSISATRSGITGAQLPAGDYAELVKRRTKIKRRLKLPNSKSASGNVVPMDHKRT